MTEPINNLYSRKILGFAASIPRVGRLAAPDARADAVSRLCGSKVHVEINVSGGAVTDYAQEVQACALGQTAASIIGANIVGATRAEIDAGKEALQHMLRTGESANFGRFGELEVLAPVKDYPARHGSVMLVFDALQQAFVSLDGERH